MKQILKLLVVITLCIWAAVLFLQPDVQTDMSKNSWPENLPPQVDILANPTAAGSFLISRHALLNHDSRTAARYLDTVLAQDPTNRSLFVQTFLIKLQNGQIEEAAKMAAALQATDPDKVLGKAVQAVNFARQNKFKEALAVLKTTASDAKTTEADASENVDDFFVSPLLEAWLRLGTGENAAAIKELQPLARNKATVPFYQLHMGLIQQRLGDAKAAEAAFSALLEENRSDLPIYFALIVSDFLEAQGRTEEAKDLQNRMVEANPFFLDFSRYHAAAPTSQAAMVQQGMAEALTSISHALNFPQNADYALIYAHLARALRPDYDFLNLMTGEILVKMQRHEESIDMLENVSAQSPFYFQAQLYISDLLVEMKEENKAIATLKNLSQAHPDVLDIYLELGDIYRRQEKYELALTAYEDAIDLLDNPQKKHWPVYYARGIVFERLGKWDKAEADFRYSLKLNPDSPYVLNYLGYGWIERGENIKESLRLIRKAVQLEPRDGHIVDSLGWAYYTLGRYPEAVKNLEQAVSLQPLDPIINDHLGDAYWRAGRHREARFQWERSLNLDTDGELTSNPAQKIEKGLPSAEKTKPKTSPPKTTPAAGQ